MKRSAEWTLGIGAVAALLNWLAGYGWHALTPAQAAAWIVLINALAGVVAAWKTRPIGPQVFTYAISSAAALAVAYGAHVDSTHVALFTDFVLAVLALVTRMQVSPKATLEGQTVVSGPPPLPDERLI